MGRSFHKPIDDPCLACGKPARLHYVKHVPDGAVQIREARSLMRRGMKHSSFVWLVIRFGHLGYFVPYDDVTGRWYIGEPNGL